MARVKGSDDLFRLIHALTPEEKSYFKKFARRHSANGGQYLKLFDAINAQPAFEEQALKKKFKGYVDMKMYLLNMVLDALMLLDINANAQNALMRQWFHLRILSRKGLTAKAIQVGKKAVELAAEAEVFWMQWNLRRQLFDMEKRSWGVVEREQQGQIYFNDLKQLRWKMEEEEIMFELHQRMFSLDNGNSFNGITNKNFEKNINLTPLFTATSSINAERVRMSALSMYYLVKRDYKMQYESALIHYKFEKKIWNTGGPMANYDKRVKTIRQYIISLLYTDRPEEVFALVDEMRSIKSTNKDEMIENEMICFNYMQYAYWGSCRHKEGEKFSRTHMPYHLINVHGDWLKLFVFEEYKFKLLLEFSTGGHKQLFNTIAEFQQRQLKKTAPHHYKSCELIKLLAHVELGEWSILPKMISTTLKHLTKYGLTAAEQVIFEKFKKITAINKRSVLKEILINLEGQEPMLIFNTVNLQYWITAQLEGKPYSEIMQRNRQVIK